MNENNLNGIKIVWVEDDKFLVSLIQKRMEGTSAQLIQVTDGAFAYDKVKEVKAMFPDLKVQIDGGVSLENAPLLKHAGADALVIGSAIFGEDNSIEEVVDNIEEFRAI